MPGQEPNTNQKKQPIKEPEESSDIDNESEFNSQQDDNKNEDNPNLAKTKKKLFKTQSKMLDSDLAFS